MPEQSALVVAPVTSHFIVIQRAFKQCGGYVLSLIVLTLTGHQKSQLSPEIEAQVMGVLYLGKTQEICIA